MTPALKLASWILGNQAALTHLKLQKLAFYCYGIGTAFGHHDALGRVPFVAWKHGPVCQELYDEYRGYGTAELEPLPQTPRYSNTLEQTLRDVLSVYGHLSAWQLRNQSHLEDPWRAWDRVTPNWPIDDATIVEHFRRKFGGQVSAPEYVSGAWSLSLDSIPSRTYATFSELAAVLHRKPSAFTT